MIARRRSEYASRNSGPIGQVLSAHLPLGAHVLEIASGTGQHAAAFAKRCADIHWYPSDFNPEAFASISDWARDVPDRIAAPRRIDVMDEWWTDLPCEMTTIYCANMIHIAPIEALHGLARGAGQFLQAGQSLLLYGPFLFGEDSAPSNLAFSERLKLRDPRWGVREYADVKQIFAINQLRLVQQITMPANNHILIFQKSE